MDLLDHPTYLGDLAAVGGLDLPWDQLKDATIVLSGASGMIGSFLVDVVMWRNRTHAMNCRVIAVARDKCRLETRFAPYLGDKNLQILVHDLGAGPLRLAEADFVFHAASNTHPVAYATDPIGTIVTNVQGTTAMLDLAVRAGARRFAFLSTVEIYGDNRGGTQRFTEKDMGYIDCNTVRAGYPESKRTGEALCQAYAIHHGLEVIIPRLPRVYGPTMKPDDSKALSQFLLKAVAGQDIVLKSEGNQFFSYQHVADVVGGLLTCVLLGEAGQAYNIAHPSGDILLKDLAVMVASSVNRQVVSELPSDTEKQGFSAATVAALEGSKLAQLGWEPLYDLRVGVERTLDVLQAMAPRG
ncbi:MAG: NAD-dependent epimerase/dehydratase family protein [Propionibacteriaceae bacterium]|nr:NAD-dependent epimerase/dehydratase family protein [Propionibacteriaceae bacterium]